MTREMYDSVTAADIPRTAAMVAGYVDGPFKWTDSDWALFPNATKVRIATRASTRDGHVIDVEYGDATPQEAVSWALQRRTDGYASPGVYVSIGHMVDVVAAFDAANVPLPLWWLAHYDNLDELPLVSGADVVAKQYIDPPVSGGHYDRSIVRDFWEGVDNMTNPLDVQITREGTQEDGTPETGQTNLAAVVAWSDSNFALLARKIDANNALLTQILQKVSGSTPVGNLTLNVTGTLEASPSAS